MNVSCSVELKGHIFDSFVLPEVMDTIPENEGKCLVQDINLGIEKDSPSYARIKISAKDNNALNKIIEKITPLGATLVNSASCFIELQGHIIDSFTLPKVIDIILENGAKCKVKGIKIGKDKESLSFAKIKITAVNEEALNKIIQQVEKHGAVVL